VNLETAYPKPRYHTKQALQMAAMEEQLAALLKSVKEGRDANEAKLEAIQTSLELWCPAVVHIQHQVDELRSQVGRIALHLALADSRAPDPEGVVVHTASDPSSSLGHHGPRGHGESIDSGGSAHGVVTTLTPPPVKGASPPSSLEISSMGLQQRRTGEFHPPSPQYRGGWVLPKLDFPSFSGENPQFWKAKCEKYFNVYSVHLDLWVRVASL